MLSGEPQSVRTKPSLPHAEASWSVLVFSVSVTYTTFKQTLYCLIEHLEEEELRVKLQKFYQGVCPTTLDSRVDHRIMTVLSTLEQVIIALVAECAR